MIKVKLKKHKTKVQLKDYVKHMDDLAIYVFPPDEPHPKSQTGESIAKIGYWNEYGARKGQPREIPARPFLRPAIRENKDKYRRTLLKLAKAILLKKKSIQFGTTYLGLMVTQDVRDKIDKIFLPENAQWTKDAKGSDKPLVDSGILRNSITFRPVK